MTFLALIALLLPGLAWWAWLDKRNRDPLVSLAQITGISLAVIILLAELVFLLGGSFSLIGIILLLSTFAGLAVAGMIRHGIRFPRKYRWHLIIGLALFSLTLAWRFYQARELLLPNWVDSQHHYLIVQVILEQGGLPQDLSPYLPVPFYYHYGYHAVTALFTTLSGLEIGRAMLILGQVLNAAISLSVYALGKALWKDWHPAAAAALLVSFATRMPAYYLSWGRYTLMTGLVLLPLAMAVALRLLSKPRRRSDVVVLALLTAGVLLSHYFAAVLLALFLVTLGIVFFIPCMRKVLTAAVQFSWVPAGASLGLLLASPWLLRVAHFSSITAGIQSNLPSSIAAVTQSPDTADYIWKLLGPASDHWLLPIAGVGLVLALVWRTQVALGIWSLLLAFLTLPWSFSLHPFRPDHFAIVLFLPVTLWAGWLFWRAGSLVGKWLKQRWVTLVVMVLLVASWVAWGFPLGSDIVNSVTVLVTEEDLDALEWVKENTPEDARFFINTTYWQNNIYRSIDGGGWLLSLTGRWAIVPTVFYSFSPEGNYKLLLMKWGAQANTITTCSEEFWELVNEIELDWIYIRKDVGSLQPDDFNECANIQLVYQNGIIWIFRIGE